MKITVTYFARPGRREEFLHRVVTAGILSAIRGEDGCLREELTSDGVHLNVKGCRAWLEYLRTHPVGETEIPAETESGAEPEELAETP